MIKNLIFTNCILMVLFTSEINAQNKYYSGILPNISMTGKMNDKYKFNLLIYTIGGRYTLKTKGADHHIFSIQNFLQGSIIRELKPDQLISLGYTYQRNYPYLSNYTNEHRILEQYLLTCSIRSLKQTNRIRLEERFINNRLNRKYNYSTRFRYQFGLNYSLKGEKLKGTFLSGYTEFCFSTARFEKIEYTEQWIYGGFGYKLNKNHKIELGYLNMKLMRKTGNLHLSLLQILWRCEMDLKKTGN